jgi:hypothetical protein
MPISWREMVSWFTVELRHAIQVQQGKVYQNRVMLLSTGESTCGFKFENIENLKYSPKGNRDYLSALKR